MNIERQPVKVFRAEAAKTGRAKCRTCHQVIAKVKKAALAREGAA